MKNQFGADSLLGLLNEKTIDALRIRWRERVYAPGNIMVTEDDPAQDVWFLLSGSAKAAVVSGGSGREVAFLVLSPGDCFGEFSAIDQAPRSSSVVALEECRAARLSAPIFRDIVRERPDFAFALCQVLVAKLRGMTERVFEITVLSVHQRVSREILKLARRNRIKDGDMALISPPPTQEHLASFLGTDRATVARAMGEMRDARLIHREGRAIRVPSIAALEAAVADEALAKT